MSAVCASLWSDLGRCEQDCAETVEGGGARGRRRSCASRSNMSKFLFGVFLKEAAVENTCGMPNLFRESASVTTAKVLFLSPLFCQK